VSNFTKSPTKSNRPKCSPERHLWRYGLSLAIYERVGELTNGGENEITIKRKTLSEYFGSNQESTRRAFNRLVNGGWFQPLPEKGHYKFVPHDARALSKKDCKELPDLPFWSIGADPFVGKIHAASGGKIRVMPNWLGAARQNCSEEEFLEALRQECANGKPGGAAHKFWTVVRHFRAKKKDRL
jgi:hypothetical protein